MLKVKENLLECLHSMSEEDLVSVHNAMCDRQSAEVEEYYYAMDDFDDCYALEDWKPFDIVKACYYGEFNPQNRFFYFDFALNLSSTNHPSHHINIYKIANYIVDNMDDLDNNEIREIINLSKNNF